eukprot:974537-Prorocentrum_minimum.AAC.1
MIYDKAKNSSELFFQNGWAANSRVATRCPIKGHHGIGHPGVLGSFGDHAPLWVWSGGKMAPILGVNPKSPSCTGYRT